MIWGGVRILLLPPSSQRDFNKVFINIVQKFSSTFPADLRRTHCTVQYIYIINNEKIESPAQTDPVCFWTAREKFLLNYKWRFYYTFSNEIANNTVKLLFENFCFIDSANYLCVFFLCISASTLSLQYTVGLIFQTSLLEYLLQRLFKS